jgi:2-succinyl-5-enolpyruvyl-6-hydroxy-3-cyclohexene-1-carboxylate synthase
VRDGRIRLHVHPDERSAAFVALGLGLARSAPAVVVCTSGTAAAELHPAVVEAHQARVPLLVVTTDRPPELRDVGAPQTIDQTHLFGRAVRRFVDPGVPDEAGSSSWRSLGARVVADSLAPVPGPVHLNLPFREPLVGEAGSLPPGRRGERSWHRHPAPASPDPLDAGTFADALAGRRGVILAGYGVEDPAGVHRLAARLRWPVLADPRSGARLPRTETVSHADALLRVPSFAERVRPEVVLRLGDLPASKVVGTWLAGLDAWQVGVHGAGAWSDPDRTLGGLVTAPPGAWCAAVAGALDGDGSAAAEPWLRRWCAADAAAAEAIGTVLAAQRGITEPAAARAVLAALPDDAALVVSSSMPVRDVEWYGAPRDRVRVLANRGANGIDGVTSTAVGVALAGAPTACLVGDLAFLHDSNGLWGLADRAVDLVVVVVDNAGGGIFSFLPQATALPADQFERFWGTPHRVDLPGLVRAHGLAVAEPESAGELGRAVAAQLATGGPSVVVVRTERAANVAVHEALHEAVRDAVAPQG